MNFYKIVADVRVKQDLKDAKTYLNSKRYDYGKLFFEEYKNLLKYLQETPYFEVKYNHINCIPFKKFKYMVHYTIYEKENIVHILAVLSTYLNPNDNFIK